MSSIGSKKIRTAYFCTQCGTQHPRWQGQCRECSQWNTLIEEKIERKPVGPASKNKIELTTIAEITTEKMTGIKSGIAEFDRVLGGQLLPGMTVLIGGEPGIGKSTLILQAADAYARQGLSVLYVSAEESLGQLKIRSDRLGVEGTKITAVNTTSLQEILGLIESGNYQVVLIDSIQTIASEQFDSPPGTVAQVREAAAQLIGLSKARNSSLFLIGHVTKDGMVAGPKVLEHMVDTVIYFEGDSAHLYRILRATKNRYGSVAEIGVFEMMPEGLVEVENPSSLFLTEHTGQARSGSVVTAICEGNRPILLEVQALVTPANYGTPQRVAGGLDNKRLALLLAILDKRGGYPMANNDVFVSIAGGLKPTEPALDLPILVAVVSSLLDRAVTESTIVIGEAGLSGEVRGVTMADRRLSEAVRMGFKSIVLPDTNLAKLPDFDLKVTGARTIAQAIEAVLE